MMMDADLIAIGAIAGIWVLRSLLTVVGAGTSSAGPTFAFANVVVILSFSGVVAWFLVQTQRQRDTAGDATHARVDAMERIARRHSGQDGGGANTAFVHRVDGNRYSQRVAMPSASLPLRSLKLRPRVVNAMTNLMPLFMAHRGTVTRVLTILEDFYARIDALKMLSTVATAAIHPDPQVSAIIARSLGQLHDARSDALNELASLEWCIPPAMQNNVVRKARRIIQRQTLDELRVLTDPHVSSPAFQAADWRPPYAASSTPLDTTTRQRAKGATAHTLYA